MGKKTKDLERENEELRKKVIFFESWLNDEVKKTSPEAEEEIKKLKKRVDELKDSVGSATKRRLEAEKQSRDLELKNQQLTEKLDEANSRYLIYKQQYETLDGDFKEAQTLYESVQNDVALLQKSLKSRRRCWNYLHGPGSKMPPVGEDVLVCCADMRMYFDGMLKEKSRIQFGTLALNAVWNGKEWFGVPPHCTVAAWQPFASIPKMSLMEEYIIKNFEVILNDKSLFKDFVMGAYKLSDTRKNVKDVYALMDRAKKCFETYRHAHRLHDKSEMLSIDLLTFKRRAEANV